jgi:AraC-like DNA-binding protein
LRALSAWKLGDHGIGDYLNATCSTVRDVLSTVTEFVGLLHDGVRFSTRTDGDRTYFVCEVDADVSFHRWWPESCLGKVVVELERAFAQQPVAGLRAVHFAHTPPSYEREYHGVDMVLPTADPVLHGLLLRQASSMLPTRRAKRSLLERVRIVAREELATSFGDQSKVAQRLGMSSATLRRRLEHEHSARYANILSDLRRDIAVSCLAESTISIEEIGRRAGFSQKTAFYRAFKRWLGCTPAEYRRANRVR